MGVYIPNMSKPKNCFQCSFNDGIYCCLIDTDTDALIPKMPTERLPLCPLIEIDLIRCEECNYREKNHYCVKWGQPYLCKDGVFCSYGERRE